MALLERFGYAVERLRRLRGEQKARHTPHAFLDLLALKPDWPPLAVYLAPDPDQDLVDAVALTLALLPAVRAWLATGNELEVWAWEHNGRGGRWHLRRVPVG